MELGLAQGIDQVIFAANRALLPLALECGWEARPLGPPLGDGNDEVTAVAAAITPQGLRKVRDRHGIPDPVIRRVGPMDQAMEGDPARPRLGPSEHAGAP